MLRVQVEPPFGVIPHVLIVMPYLCVLIWRAIRGDVRFLMLVPQVLMMVPHPSKSLIPLQ
jgi:hypothetical protein